MSNKRSIVIAGRKTSVSLEGAFWNSLKEIGSGQAISLSDLISDIDARRLNGNLSSAIRLFVLAHYQTGTTGISPTRVADVQQLHQSPQATGSGL